MKKLNATLGDIDNMAYNIIGDNLLKFRRKKKSSKRKLELQ